MIRGVFRALEGGMGGDVVHFGIDIDGTIAGRNLRAFAAACGEHFGVRLSPTAECQLTYEALLKHPALVARRQASAENFDDLLQRIEQTPSLLRAAPPLPDAVAGVQKLTHYGSPGYYTVRKAYVPFTAMEVGDATRDWLCEHQFPASDQVYFCMSLMNKWLQFYRRLRASPEPVFFIDDLAPQLASAFCQLQSGAHPRLSSQECRQVASVLKQHVTLVAFGRSSSLAITSDLRITSLSAWRDVDDFIAHL